MNWPRSFRYQLILMLAVLALSLSLAYIIYSGNKQGRFVLESIRLQNEVLAHNISINSTNHLLTQNYSLLEELLLSSSISPDILSMRVLDAEGNTISWVVVDQETKSAKVEFTLDKVAIPVKDDPNYIYSEHDFHKAILPQNGTEGHVSSRVLDDELVIWHPIALNDSKIMGWITVRVSLAPVSYIRQQIIRDGLLVSLLIVLIFIPVFVIFLRQPLHTLHKAVNFASHLSDANGSILKVGRSAKEFEKLVAALNYSSQRLYEQESTILATSERLEAVLTYAEDAIITFDLELSVQSFNPAAERMFGLVAHDIVGKSLQKLFVSRVQTDNLPHLFAESLSDPEGCRADGSSFPLEASISRMDVRGEQYCILIARDITARKDFERNQARQQNILASVNRSGQLLLKRSDDIDQSVQESLHHLAKAAEVDCAFLYENHREEEELLSSATQRYIAPLEDASLGKFGAIQQVSFSQLPNLYAQLELGQSYQNLINDMAAPEKDFYRSCDLCSLLAVPITLEGVFWGFISLGNRSEKRLWQEAEVAVVHSFARSIGHALIRYNTERELTLAKESAEKASRAKDDFLSRVSHELRTPLNAILGFAQLLELDDLSEQQDISVKRILSAGNNLLELINEVLDISRIESGRMTLSLEPVRLYDCILNAQAYNRTIAQEKHINIIIKVNKNLFVHADKQRLTQVLMHLISNAIKYNDNAGQVRIESYSQGKYLRLEIADTGIGIPNEQLQNLFVPFDRMHAEKLEIEGSGLGLALSQRLIQMMHGSVQVASIVGQGSTFTVELEQTTMPQLGRCVENPVRQQYSQAEDKPTILYIEDNLSNLEVLEQLLVHTSDIALITAMQGQRGIEMAKEHKPALILLDLHLPDMTGDLVLKEFKADPTLNSIPVVMVSADATDTSIDHLKRLGAAEYLTKPIELQAFQRMLKRQLQTR